MSSSDSSSESPPRKSIWRRSLSNEPMSPKHPHKNRQDQLNIIMARINSAESPYTYNMLLQFVAGTVRHMDSSILSALMSGVEQLQAAAGSSSIYLADGLAFIGESLDYEFPELSIFKLKLSDAFTESTRFEKIWIETAHFANLRSMSNMRREIRKRGLSDVAKTVQTVQLLLGCAN